ncbi:hypothetical protein ACFSUS_13310 [Spirosoma soli]|uniref:Anti-sigma factor n=1 Tax=Spirosoma soli TaxID=1770529 RepID=A0ABW5M3M9_9BACT
MTLKTHHYLTSGILESYLLGIVSDKEKEEVERVLATDPDVLSQLNELEIDIENYFLENAVPPPPAVRNAVLSRIGDSEIKKWEPTEQTRAKQDSAESKTAGPQYLDVEVSDTHIRVHKYWRPAFIAVFVLSKVFLVLGLYYYFKSNSQDQEIERLKAQIQQSTSLPRGRTQ